MTEHNSETLNTCLSISLREQDDIALFRAFQGSHDPALRARIICDYLHLVQSVARRFLGLGEALDDLIQEGTIGLLNAVDLFDPERGVRFSTYACPLIAGQIQHYLRDRGRLIRQPAWVQELNTKITRAIEQLAQELGREPCPAEVAERLKVTEETVKNALAARELNHVMSLSAPIDATGETDTALADKETLSATKLAAANISVEDRIVLEEAVRTLKPLEQQVIHLFFFRDLNQSEIARKLEISVNYSSYLLRRAIAKIKGVMDEHRRREEEQMDDAADVAPPPSAVQTYDSLTGTYTEDYLRLRVGEEIARSQRYPTNFALMYAAVHGLESVQETRQSVLAALTRVFRQSTRVIDLIAYRPDLGFLLLLPHTGREARVLGERLCRQVATRHRLPAGTPEALALNVGFAVFPLEGASVAALFDRASSALAQACEAGPYAVSSVTTVWPAPSSPDR